MASQKHNEFVRNSTIQMQSRALLSGGPYSHQKDTGIIQHVCDLDLLKGDEHDTPERITARRVIAAKRAFGGIRNGPGFHVVRYANGDVYVG